MERPLCTSAWMGCIAFSMGPTALWMGETSVRMGDASPCGNARSGVWIVPESSAPAELGRRIFDPRGGGNEGDEAVGDNLSRLRRLEGNRPRLLWEVLCASSFSLLLLRLVRLPRQCFCTTTADSMARCSLFFAITWRADA